MSRLKIKKNFDQTMRIDLPPEVISDQKAKGDTGRMVRSKLMLQFIRQSENESPSNMAQIPQMLKGIYDAVLIMDENGRIIDTNDRAESFLQYPRADLIKLNIEHILSGADKKIIRTVIQTLQSDRHVLLQAFCVRKDRTTFPAEISANFLNFSNSKYCLFIRDITVRRQAEEMLQTCYHAINNARGGIAIIDMDSAVIFANPACLRLWGLKDAQEAAGRSIGELWQPGTEALSLLNALASRHLHWEGEMRLRLTNGRESTLYTVASATRNSSGEMTGMVLSLTDITDRKRVEESNRKAEGQRAMIASLGTACHHIGQPATVILGSLGMLKHSLKDSHPEITSLIDESIRAAEKIGELLRQLNNATDFKTVNYLDSRKDNDTPDNKLLDIALDQDPV